MAKRKKGIMSPSQLSEMLRVTKTQGKDILEILTIQEYDFALKMAAQATSKKDVYSTIARRLNRIQRNTKIMKDLEIDSESVHVNPRESARVEKLITDAWKKFKDNYNQNLSYGEEPMDNRRFDEFASYFVAGRITDWNPTENAASYVRGDLFGIDKDGKHVQIQLKAKGGYFRIDYSPRGARQISMIDYSYYVKHIAEGKSKEVDYYQYKKDAEKEIKKLADGPTKELFSIIDVDNINRIKNDRVLLKKFMKAYTSLAKTTQWYVFTLGNSIDGTAMDFSFSIPSKDLPGFASRNKKWFEFTTTSKNGKKIPVVQFSPNGVDRYSSSYWNLGIGKGVYSSIFLHHRVEFTFYKARDKYTRMKHQRFTEKYNARVQPMGEPVDKFLVVHNAVFGGLHYRD